VSLEQARLREGYQGDSRTPRVTSPIRPLFDYDPASSIFLDLYIYRVLTLVPVSLLCFVGRQVRVTARELAFVFLPAHVPLRPVASNFDIDLGSASEAGLALFELFPKRQGRPRSSPGWPSPGD
jgi:hypothetical protein